MRHTTTAILLTVGLALAGCTSGSASKPAAKPKATHTVTTYTFDDCKALLEKHYQAGNVHDAEAEPECRGLTHGQYTEAVKAVVMGHKDEIVADAKAKVMYDQVWDSLGTADQQSVCDTMDTSSPEAVGAMLDGMVDDPSVDTTKMAQYFYDEKC
ncbi:hypothetical protein [Streptomyces sp. BK340]|uniref:hypothetical protein n=1 Tax=Streptomyces sp. BK340 TaxID=2572903 RepID=UPI0011A6562F|nr:hypothetical protein [Streptomyces sp. BK340]TVZ96499.1 hypothetical protein FB157_103410 [Streptomyces sp. BK340]